MVQHCWSVQVLTKFLSNVFYSLSQQQRFTLCIYLLCYFGETVSSCYLYISDLFYTFSIALDLLYKNHNTTFWKWIACPFSGAQDLYRVLNVLDLQTNLLSYPDPQAKQCSSLFLSCPPACGNRAHFDNVVFVIKKRGWNSGLIPRQ
jgi:hypothetical protein